LAYDNICKHLVEEYPAEFVRWLSGEEVTDIQVLKTDLVAWLDEHQSV
jgi:predicted transposase YdaD